MASNNYLPADPGNVLIALGAVVALFAALYWWKVARSIDTSGQAVTGPDKRSLGHASLLTAIALALAAGGYLAGLL